MKRLLIYFLIFSGTHSIGFGQTIQSILSIYEKGDISENDKRSIKNTESSCQLLQGDSISLNIEGLEYLFQSVDKSNIYTAKQILDLDTSANPGLFYVLDSAILYFSLPPKEMVNVDIGYIRSISMLNCELQTQRTLYLNNGFVQYMAINKLESEDLIVVLPKINIHLSQITIVNQVLKYLDDENYRLFSSIKPSINSRYSDYLWVTGNIFQNSLLNPKID